MSCSIQNVLVALATLVLIGESHPNWAINPTWFNPKCENPDNITFYSFHVHVLFNPNCKTSVNQSFALRDEFMEAFNVTNDIPCNDVNTTHNQSPNLCMVDMDYPNATCPFLTTEWAVFVPNHDNDSSLVVEVLTWFMKRQMPENRFLDIYIHPNSGCEIYDHRNWNLWLGHPHRLNLTCLHYDAPGYAINDCKTNAMNILFQNDYSSICGLKIDEKTGRLSIPITQEQRNEYCGSGCQEWVRTLLQFTKDCPNDCSLWTDDGNEEYECQVQWNSVIPMQLWSYRFCPQ